jgi:hypothetical protein
MHSRLRFAHRGRPTPEAWQGPSRGTALTLQDAVVVLRCFDLCCEPSQLVYFTVT